MIRWGKRSFNRRTRRKRKRLFSRSKKQKGGALGAGLALGMLVPQLLNTTGQILKIKV